ncbi:MAG: dihydrofolate reductase family protein [Bacteroidota bacterium]|nr:dihydrofolate reductase family protein [Bacteroidota bacterium]
MNSTRKVILYIAMSLDGYIGRQDGDLDWLMKFQSSDEDYGYQEFIKTVDTVIMGRKTYDTILSFDIDFPHLDKKCYIVTRQERPAEENISFYTGDMKNLISQLKSSRGKNIFVDGGAEIVNELMKYRLIDEYIISIIPLFLGSGIRLFNDARPEERLRLLHCKKFESGLTQLHYTQI